MIVFQIGIQIIEEDLAKNTYERLKKDLKLITRGVNSLFTGYDEMS